MPRERRARALTFAALVLAAGCHPSSGAPWPSGGGTVLAEHAEVRTVNAGYTRTRSHVLVREVDLERAVGTLRHAGHEVDTGQGITFPAKRVN